MKALISTPKPLMAALTVLALAGLTAAPISASAQVQGAGASQLVAPVTRVASPTVAGGDHAGPGCNSCRTKLISVSVRPAKTGAAAETKLIARADCPECVNKIVTQGTGKLAKDVVVHACKQCGSAGTVCCAGK